jgi:hypothetical protein
VSVYFGNHQILKVGIFGDQHVYSILVCVINIFITSVFWQSTPNQEYVHKHICHAFGLLNA